MRRVINYGFGNSPFQINSKILEKIKKTQNTSKDFQKIRKFSKKLQKIKNSMRKYE
jgi:hypothetical protein